jgi:hypothetical protein
MCKEAVVAFLSPYPIIYMEGLRKSTRTSDNKIGAQAEIRVGHIPNTNQKLYFLRQLAPCKGHKKPLYYFDSISLDISALPRIVVIRHVCTSRNTIPNISGECHCG